VVAFVLELIFVLTIKEYLLDKSEIKEESDTPEPSLTRGVKSYLVKGIYPVISGYFAL